MGWMEEARAGAAATQVDFNAWGRAQYMNNYAQGGIASHMFPHQDIKARHGLRGALGMKTPVGSRAYKANLQSIIKHGSKEEVAAATKLLGKKSSSIVSKLGRAALGGAMGAAFLALPALTTEGSIGDKGKAVAGGAANWAGSVAGMKAGIVGGAAIGSFVPVIGTAVGALAGGIAGFWYGGQGAEHLMGMGIDTFDRIAERGKRSRTSNWIGDMSAFQTQKAATMRQASLQMMNNGLMTARSALGNEGVMFHQ